MTDRQRRQKASDLFRESSNPFAPKATFEKAYPQIKALRVDIMESDGGVDETPVYWTDGEYADCSNPHCYGGGVSIGAMLRDMVRERATKREFTALCKGNEGSPKGRRIYRKCLHAFTVQLEVEYREDSGPATQA